MATYWILNVSIYGFKNKCLVHYVDKNSNQKISLSMKIKYSKKLSKTLSINLSSNNRPKHSKNYTKIGKILTNNPILLFKTHNKVLWIIIKTIKLSFSRTFSFLTSQQWLTSKKLNKILSKVSVKKISKIHLFFLLNLKIPLINI